MVDMKEFAKHLLEVQSKALLAGRDIALQSEQSRIAPAIRTLRKEFQQALIDPDARMKSSLQIAILGVLQLLNEQEVNGYANAGIKRDQLVRHEGRDDHDQTTRGGSLRDAA